MTTTQAGDRPLAVVLGVFLRAWRLHPIEGVCCAGGDDYAGKEEERGCRAECRVKRAAFEAATQTRTNGAYRHPELHGRVAEAPKVSHDRGTVLRYGAPPPMVPAALIGADAAHEP
ncbi:hypothetical protein CALCODRAFT_486847 [Calocera cornea HHB12733]|uniref:Uncharacterized protein n=1 Tax=Calocera cornea HHB12733 TaxID=1353952 RepID=A0A165DH73_9BASI|nr:hypothetical protein CALCODRAFT_486847 [Calocera cornea HHB12733]